MAEPSEEDDYLTHTLLRFTRDDSKIEQPFQFKSFAPKVFKKLRRTFNVDDESYLGSLTMADVVHFQTSSKSGGFFFFTNDGKYLIKTATKKELDFFLKKLCKDYYNHILEYADTSLLVRFMGFYELEAPHVKKIGFSTTRFIGKARQLFISSFQGDERLTDYFSDAKRLLRVNVSSVPLRVRLKR